jgi:hypothetical protein
VTVISCLVLLNSNCAQRIETRSETLGEPDFTGFITSTTPGNGFVGTIIVESHADKLLSRVALKVKADTPIFLFENSEGALIEFNRLNNQDRVHVWYAGSPSKGFPTVVTAKQIYVFRND